MTRPPRVAVIGAGWSGLSCAEALLQSPTPVMVDLFEQSPHLGGRARGLLWETNDGKTHAIDNGQHLTIGAYVETFALLRRVHAPQWKREPLIWSGIRAPNLPVRSWHLSSKAWPWRMAQSMLGRHAPRHWPLAWRWSLARAAWDLTSNGFGLKGTVCEWLEKIRAPKDLIGHFWQPLAEGALNTEIQTADAGVFACVLRDSLGAGQGSTDVLTPASNLSVDGVDAIARHLLSKGIRIRTATRIVSVSTKGTLVIRKGSEASVESFDALILALPAAASAALWIESGLPHGQLLGRWQAADHRAITTAWISLDETAQQKAKSLPAWFVLDDLPGHPRPAQVCVQRPGVLAAVMSAQGSERFADRDALNHQLRTQLGIQTDGLPQKWITEKKATWACTPDRPQPSLSETQGLTDWPAIFRAADDLEAGYPATIESAVRSGQRTARSVIARVLDPAPRIRS